ncbi:hypothetical protein CJF30_00011279 [Rutstroemia sp. NJR-2017a BBW]|nr:hypothetical protein CJF30_00011279 [Rutstroemia sp. NJR-2017a BBW]
MAPTVQVPAEDTLKTLQNVLKRRIDSNKILKEREKKILSGEDYRLLRVDLNNRLLERVLPGHPIKEGLVAFRRQFESSQARLSFVESSRAIEDILSAESASDLFSLGSKVASRDFDIKSIIPLVELVVNNAPDVEIWHAVFNLILTTSPKRVTPPTAFEKAVFDTPLRSSSASQRGVEQTHDEVDQRILEELTGRVYYDIGGFYERYFKGKS